MSAAPDLDQTPDPEWLKSPSTRLERQFALWHRANPHVARELANLALRLVTRGVPRIGMKQLFEVLRFSKLETTGEPFKLNNSYTALYARLLIHRYPILGGRFELRERVERSRP